MGKRKSARKPGAGKTKMAPLDKSFKCLFCQHTGTVTCKLDTKKKNGRLDCKDCGQTFMTDINRTLVFAVLFTPQESVANLAHFPSVRTTSPLFSPSLASRLDLPLSFTSSIPHRLSFSTSYALPLSDLTEPIDIYAEWIDACKDVNPEEGSPPPAAAPRKRAAPRDEDDEDVEGEGQLDHGNKKARNDAGAEDEEEEELPDYRRKAVVDDDEE